MSDIRIFSSLDTSRTKVTSSARRMTLVEKTLTHSLHSNDAHSYIDLEVLEFTQYIFGTNMIPGP
jgi:hypothetical protein